MAVFQIGPDTAIKELHWFPWNTLQPDDTVQVSWRPEPYRSKIQLSVAGISMKPIRIIGIPGPEGQLPVVSGENAIEMPDTDYFSSQVTSQGVFSI